jgi:sulfur-oxidizing protein SoxZ
MDQPTIKMRVTEKEGVIWLRALIKHPMETGLRKDKKTGMKIPSHYISDVLVESNGETVFSADWSASLSKNPFLSIKFYGSKGDTVRLTWKDNMGNSDFVEKTVGKK